MKPPLPRSFLAVSLLSMVTLAQAQVPIPTPVTPVLQDFNSLANTGTSNASVPPGWVYLETGTSANGFYAAGTGSSSSGDTYSFGASGNTERAFGSLRTGSLVSLIGASFQNTTGAPLTALVISYFGEHWRLGNDSGRLDRLDFQYSLDAAAINGAGTWVDVTALDFTTPDTIGTGAKNGNDAQHRVRRIALINNLNIPHGAVFHVRLADFDADGADDGLAIDDFSIAGFTETPAVIQVENLNFIEGDVDSNARVRVSLVAPVSANVSFDAQTTAGSAMIGVDYQSVTVPGNLILAGNTSTIIAVPVEGDTDIEPGETFGLSISNVTTTVPLVIANNSGVVTVINDDPRMRISDIQGNGAVTPIPLPGNVSFEGIVTGVAARGFFVQEEDADADADPMSSEGVFVFMNQTVPADLTLGVRVRVVGALTEFNRNASSQKLSVTEVVSPVIVTVADTTPQPLPAAIVLPDPSAANSIDTYERFEGMRVSLPGNLRVVGPTDGSMVDITAAAVPFGTLYVTKDGVPRPFREPGHDPQDILSDVPIACGAPGARPCNDSNEEIIGLDTDDFQTPALELSTGNTVSGATGPLHYDFGGYFIVQDLTTPLTVGSEPSITPAPPVNGRTVTVASFNMQRFYDDVDDLSADANEEPVVTANGLELRMSKFSTLIRGPMRLPDIIGVIEVENLGVLQRLADRINLDAGADNPEYGACLIDGIGFGKLDVGFLYKQRRVGGPGSARRVDLPACFQELSSLTHIDPRDGSIDPVFDRPPLRLRAIVNDRNGQGVALTVIVNHFLSLLSVSDTTVDGASTDGERGRQKRRAQAESLAAYVHTRQANNLNEQIIVLGDFNAFQFNDGYGDVVGGVAGLPAAAADQLTPVSDQLLNGDLINLWPGAPAAQRYSYVEGGSAQTLDHILINGSLQAAAVATLHPVRVNADFANGYRNLPGDARRASDHDPIIAYLDFASFNDPPITVATLPDQTTPEGATVSYPTAFAFSEPDGETLTFSATNLPAGLLFNTGTGEISGAPALGSAGVYNVQISATDGFANAFANFSLTVNAASDAVFANGFE